MKWINYHHLIYFKEIARLGSISKASQHLNIGQPALSAQLKKLEEYMGVQLFERRNRRLFLTDAGKVTLEYSEKIGDLGQELIQVIHQQSFRRRISLSVGAVDAIPKHLISTIVDFAHKKTGCFLSILEGPPSDLLREIIAHRIDVIITDQDLISQNTKNLFSKKIISGNVGAYATNKFIKLRKNFPHSLNGVPAILPTNHSRLHAELEHYFHTHHIFLDRIAETQDSMLQKILASKGDGVIFLPDLAVTNLIQKERLIKLGTLKNVIVEFYLLFSKRIIENPALNQLIKQDFNKIEFD